MAERRVSPAPQPVVASSRSNGRTGPRAKKRRREIIDAAAQVFFEKGYDASSTQDIADAAGILKGSLYYYIRSKEDFLFEIVQETHEGALRNLDPMLAAPGDALDKLAMFVIRQVEYFAAHNVYATVFFREYRALSAERRRPIESKGDLYRLFVSDLLRQGIREGKVNAEIDVRTASISMVEMLNSIHRWYRPGGRQSASRIARDLATVLVVGIASAEAIEDRGGIEAFRRELRELKVGGLVPFA